MSRIPELDGLRGIAVLLVLLLHTKASLFFWGWAGVDLFLVLSGFLITRILLENQGQPGMLRAFYIRRALRIWPVYYLTLLATAGLFVIAAPLEQGGHAPVPAGHWRSLLFIQNGEHYFDPASTPTDYIWFFQHSWSVAVEEQFYLLWPLILLAFGGKHRTLLILALGVLGAAYVARASSMSMHILLTRIDGLVLGCAIAYGAYRHPDLLTRLGVRVMMYGALTGVALVGPYLALGFIEPDTAFGPRAAPVLGFALLFAVAVWMSLQYAGDARLWWLRLAPLRWAGQISFGLYMYHVPIGYLGLLGVHHGLWSNVTAKAIMWGASLVVAHLSYTYLERPILSLKSSAPYRPRAISAHAQHTASDVASP